MEYRPHGVLESALYFQDLSSAARFYHEIIGLEQHACQPDRHVFFRCGAGMLLLFRSEATRQATSLPDGQVVPGHGSHGAGHLALRVQSHEIDWWRTHLVAHDVPIETEIRWPNGGYSLYVRDPGGNSLEFATPAVWGLTE